MADDKKAAADTPAAQDAPQAPVAPAKGLDETVPGGKYRTQFGDVVDAEGNPVKT
jgi:hypothetical protein